MEQILLAYGIPKETVAAITILYRNTKVKVRSPDGDTEYFDIVAGVLQGDTLAPYLFIICLDYVLRTSIDKIKENGFELTKKRSRRYPATTITDADYADDIAILANTPDQAETLLHSLERAAASIGFYVNAHKTEYMCYNQMGDISTLEGTPLKLVDKFTYLGSSVESTEKDIETRLTKAWTAINRLLIIWKSDLTDKMKRSFFQAAVTSILLYGCTTWTLTKRLEKKLDGNYTRMLRAILNKSWQQHPTRHQLYGHLPPITKTIQVRRTRHAGHCWRSRDELIRDVLLWIPTHDRAKVGRPARTYIQQLCEDTGCCPEDLPRAMNDMEEWRERVRDIRATSAIWWWMTMHKALHPRDDVDRIYVSTREGGRGLATIEDRVDASRQRLEDYWIKCGGRLITTTRKITSNTRASKTKITRKQKWEEKQLYRCFKRLISDISQDQIHPTKLKHYCIVWNEPLQLLASMSMHTKRNTCALIKQATFPL